MADTFNTPAQRLSDESVRMLRDLFAKHAERGATIFHQAHAEELLALAEEVIAMRSETLFTNAAPQPSTAAPGTAPSKEGVGQRDAAAAAPSDDKKDDAWRSAALRLGEQLAPTGPNWYYAMTPTQWLEWCQSALPSAEGRRAQWVADLEDLNRRIGDLRVKHGADPNETLDQWIARLAGGTPSVTMVYCGTCNRDMPSGVYCGRCGRMITAPQSATARTCGLCGASENFERCEAVVVCPMRPTDSQSVK